MSFLALAASALVLGFLHGLGADHLMAITALAVDGPANRRQARAMRTAVGFACGHALLLSFGAIAAVTLGLLIPAAISSGAERLGGGMLVAMGAFGLWSIAAGRSYGHIHGPSVTVTAGSAGPVGRWHMHLARATGAPAHPARPHHPGHAHGGSIVPLVLGALFAISSLRAVMLLQPFTPGAQALALPSLLILIALFAIGILLSMSLFGVLLARVLSLHVVNVVGRTAAATVAAASVGLGLYWMVS